MAVNIVLKENDMRTPTYPLISLLLLLFITAAVPLYAQDSTKFHISDKPLKKVTGKTDYLAPITFTNLGSTEYYVDGRALKSIQKLERDEKLDELRFALEDYISRFSAENFGQDYELMWKLAQLYDKQGLTDHAKWMYRILLKHSDNNLELIAQYYDELTENDKPYYVPIKYYYELVEYRKQVDTLRPPKGVFINMGENINSAFEDYGPSLSKNDEILFFGTKRNRKTIRGEEYINEDIYYATRDGDGWTTAKPLEGINTNYNDGAPCLSRDGQTLYFVRCETPDGMGRCDLYEARLQPDGTWGNIENLGPNINSGDWDSHPSLSITEDTMYFVSDRPGGFGSNDIYFTRRDKHGKWAPAENMGPIINTKGNELSPFIHPKYNILYFSSTGQPLNFGNFDIYKSRFINNHWEEPRNIGPLVNGWSDEHFFTIDSESNYLYYARSDENDFKQVDLYSFPLPMEAQPEAFTVFSGQITDSASGTPFKGIVSVIDLENGIEVAPKYVRPDGSFEFDLIDQNKYLLVIQGEDFFRIEKEIDLNGDTSLVIKTPSIQFTRIQFSSIEFASNSSEIAEGMKPDLRKLLDYLLDNPAITLSISGHTDARGDAQTNLDLSQRRADAIKQYLLETGGIDPERITATGYGSSQPLIKNEKTDEDRKVNRRVEFEIARPGEELKNTAGKK